MIIRYSANTLPGQLVLPGTFVLFCTDEGLAELAAAQHWRAHPHDPPSHITVVHLQSVDGKDLGLFEVRCEQQPIYTATRLHQA